MLTSGSANGNMGASSEDATTSSIQPAEIQPPTPKRRRPAAGRGLFDLGFHLGFQLVELVELPFTG